MMIHHLRIIYSLPDNMLLFINNAH